MNNIESVMADLLAEIQQAYEVQKHDAQKQLARDRWTTLADSIDAFVNAVPFRTLKTISCFGAVPLRLYPMQPSIWHIRVLNPQNHIELVGVCAAVASNYLSAIALDFELTPPMRLTGEEIRNAYAELKQLKPSEIKSVDTFEKQARTADSSGEPESELANQNKLFPAGAEMADDLREFVIQIEANEPLSHGKIRELSRKIMGSAKEGKKLEARLRKAQNCDPPKVRKFKKKSEPESELANQ